MNPLKLDDSPDVVKAFTEQWLEDHWDAALGCEKGAHDYDEKSWLARVFEAGLMVPTWPREWFGLGLSSKSARAIEKLFTQHKVPGAARDRYHLGAITLFKTGSESLKRDLLPVLLKGPICCLLYSEPNAGSDLAGVRTRADYDNGQYRINGQKVWTSNAVDAEYGMLLARTDWEVPKHKGVSFFLFPMKQAGVEVRPINQITGESEFNEVFITDALVPEQHLLGEVNEGWKSFQLAIAYERLIMGQGITERRRKSAPGDVPKLIRIAQSTGQIEDSHQRQKIAQALAYRELNKLNNDRAKEELVSTGSTALMSLSKLAMSRIQHGEARIASDLLGANGILDDADHPDASHAHFDAAKAYMNSIGGGTDQIQRNIIAERVLGLPREPEVDRDVAFKDVTMGPA